MESITRSHLNTLNITQKTSRETCQGKSESTSKTSKSKPNIYQRSTLSPLDLKNQVKMEPAVQKSQEPLKARSWLKYKLYDSVQFVSWKV